MAKYCIICDKKTNCTDSCKWCAKEIYDDLKEKAGKSECVSEEAIKHEFGKGAFNILKEYGYIEYCTTSNGRKMYAI